MASVSNVGFQESNLAFKGSKNKGKSLLENALDDAAKKIAKMNSSIPANQQMNVAWTEAVDSLKGKLFSNSVKGAEALEREMINEALMGRVMADLCNPKINTPLKK